MNLDLGGTIWLNVSRRLLSYHRHFFKRFEDMPPKVFAEFKRHRHTHPSIKVVLEHHSHTHSGVLWPTSTVSHEHDTGGYLSKTCGWVAQTPQHAHYIYMAVADSHNHTLTLAFSAADLGSPNWWVHVHAVTGTCANGGAVHTHTLTTPSTSSKCPSVTYGCQGLASHNHSTAGLSLGNGGDAHQHTWPATNSDNANPAGTPEIHNHPFSLSLNPANDHSHAFGGVPSAGTCARGKSHTHTINAFTDTIAHDHTASGTSGSGGESPAGAVLRRLLVGVGL